MANLTDLWLAHKSRYDFFLNDSRFNTDKDLMEKLRYFCAFAAARTWCWYYANAKQERNNYALYLEEMHVFCTQEVPLFGLKNWPMYVRIPIFLGRFNNNFVFALLYYMLQGFRRLNKLWC